MFGITPSFACASVPRRTQSSSLSGRTEQSSSAVLTSPVSGFLTSAFTLHVSERKLLPPKIRPHLRSPLAPICFHTLLGTTTSRSCAPLFRRALTETFLLPLRLFPRKLLAFHTSFQTSFIVYNFLFLVFFSIQNYGAEFFFFTRLYFFSNPKSIRTFLRISLFC